MNREFYIRRRKRDPIVKRKLWDTNQGITEEKWNQEQRIIRDTEELHFLYDTDDDATELQEYIYEKLHLRSNFWDVCREEYEQLIEKFGTPIGIELSILYFAIIRSFSGNFDNDDTGIPIQAWQDVGIFGNPQDSQYWREGIKEIDEGDLRDVLHGLPIQPRLSLEVYAFFLFQFCRYTFVPYNPKVKNKHERKRVSAWISYLKKLISATNKILKSQSRNTQEQNQKHSTLLPNGTKTTDVARCLAIHFEGNDDIRDYYLTQASLEKAAARIFNLDKKQIHTRWQDAKKEGTTESKRINIIKLLPIVEAVLLKDIRSANGIGTD